MSNTVIIILLVILVLLSFLFSISEISYSSINPVKIESYVDSNKKGSKLVSDIYNNFEKMISTILIGNNLVNILASSLMTVLALRLFKFEGGTTVGAIIITIVILTMGEIFPKLLGKKFNYLWVFIVSIPLKIASIIFFPIVWLVTKFINLLAPLYTPKVKEASFNDEELIDIVESIEEDGLIDEDNSDLIKSAIKFSDIDAYDIIVPRIDVRGIELHEKIADIFKDDDIFQYSYVPVYKENLDDIVGVVSTRKLLQLKLSRQRIIIKDLLEEPLYVHETMPLDALYKEMNKHDAHMAIVIDEYGGMDGIITPENIMEELVGEIFDENEEVEYEYEEKGNNEYIIDGDMNIDDFFDLVDIDKKDFESEYSTINGWLSEVLEKLLDVGDTYTYRNMSFEVLEVEDFTATKIKVKVLPEIEE